MSVYDLERSLDVARRVMGRRNTVMSEVEEKVFRKVFELTQQERWRAGMRALNFYVRINVIFSIFAMTKMYFLTLLS